METRARKKMRLTLESQPKGVQVEEEPVLDLLSRLPNDLLVEILALLPFRQAVQSSLLSRSWRNLWTLLPAIENLDLDPLSSLFKRRSFPDPDQLEEYNEWVFSTKPLLSARSGLIRRCQCRIIYGSEQKSIRILRDCMEIVAGRGIQDLKLSSTMNRLVFPSCVFEARSLTSLELRNWSFLVNGPSQVKWSCLRTLKLDRVRLHGSTLQAIVAACGCLETLHVADCMCLMTCQVESLSIKRLILSLTCGTKHIMIDAPGLEELNLRLKSSLKNISMSCAATKKATLYVDTHYKTPYQRIAPMLMELVLGMTSLSELVLLQGFVGCLSMVHAEKRFQNNMFDSLLRLSIRINLDDKLQVFFLNVLLRNCLQLQELSLIVNKGTDYQAVSRQITCELWEDLNRMRCPNPGLKDVTICHFTANPNQVQMAKLILRRAESLRNMTISLSKKCSVSQVMEAMRLLSFKAASQGVKVKVEP